jgi:putative ABC transport system ATP-binding protein
MIEVEHVSRTYRRGQLTVSALVDVSCTIADESCTFILGPSGSGKSSLLYLLGALDTPTSGSIRVDGRDIFRFSPRERDRYRREDVGFIFQNFNLLANLNAVDNVLIPFYPLGITSKQREVAARLLERLGLGSRLDHKPNQLSGGEQQRVAIARALFKNPRLILADEPTGELDSQNSRAVLADLRRLCRDAGATVVIVTHEQEYLEPGDHVIRIRDGRVAETSRVGDLASSNA